MMVSELLSDRVGRRTNDGIRKIPKTSPKIKARTSRKQRDETVITKGPGTIILRYHSGQFHQIPADPRHSIRWVAFRRNGGSGVAVGNKGLVLNFNGVTFGQQNSPSQEISGAPRTTQQVRQSLWVITERSYIPRTEN